MAQVRQTFLSDLRHLRDIRLLVREACRQARGADANEEMLAQIELAVNEAAVNMILHAYEGEKDRPIEVVIDSDAELIRVSLYHGGKEFDPRSVEQPVFDGSREGGFGLYLIKQSVNEVHYVRGEDGRCGIVLIKRLA